MVEESEQGKGKVSKDGKRSVGCFWGLIILLVLMLSVSLFLNIGLLATQFWESDDQFSGTRPADQFPEFRATWSYGEGTVRVIRIPLQGVIMRNVDGGFLMPRQDPVSATLQRIRAAQNDASIRGILLEVDSPGGAVTPSDEIYQAVRSFRMSHPDRRVVVFSRDLVASGGYYVSVAADWIVTEPTCLVGSIGTMLQTINWHALSDRLGITDVTLKSGDNKDTLNPFRETKPQELALLQTIVDQMHDRFVDIVQEERGFERSDIEAIADGRILIAPDALDAGLIDQIGYWPDAVRHMAELLNVDDVRVFRYERRMDWSEWLMTLRHPIDVRRVIPAINGPQVLYLWQP